MKKEKIEQAYEEGLLTSWEREHFLQEEKEMKEIILDKENRLYRLMEAGKEVDFSSSANVLRRKYGKDIPIKEEKDEKE